MHALVYGWLRRWLAVCCGDGGVVVVCVGVGSVVGCRGGEWGWVGE